MRIVLPILEKNVNVLEVKLPEKKEGARMECLNCGHDLICRTKDYGGDYKPKLQWQNEDGTAHYKTKDGKNFECVLPQDDESQEVHTEETIIETNTSDGNYIPNTATKKELEKVPEIDPELGQQMDDETLLQYQVYLRTRKFIEKFENNPNGGMIGEFKKHNFKKFFKPNFKKGSEV